MKRTTYYCDRCMNDFRAANSVVVYKQPLDLCDTCNAEFDALCASFIQQKAPKFKDVNSVSPAVFALGNPKEAGSVIGWTPVAPESK